MGKRQKGGARKPGANLSDISKLPPSIIGTEQQRTQVLPTPFRPGEAPDHEFFLLVNFYLQPTGRTATHIRGGVVFCHDSFKPAPFCQPERLESIRGQAPGDENLPILGQDIFKHLAPLFEWFLPKVGAIRIQAVEYCVTGRVALLKKLEAGHFVAIEGNDFAVKENRPLLQMSHSFGHARERVRAILVIARKQSHLRAFFIGKNAVPVVFLLVYPTRSVEGLADQSCQHWLSAKGNDIVTHLHGPAQSIQRMTDAQSLVSNCRSTAIRCILGP